MKEPISKYGLNYTMIEQVSKMIDELTNPTDPKHPAFHVVAPS